MWLSAGGAALGGLVMAGIASAQVIVVPTSTASTLTANVGTQVSDPGTLLVVVLAAGIPLAFYVIHQLIGLIPKSRGRRQ
jgi:hypothetical protein